MVGVALFLFYDTGPTSLLYEFSFFGSASSKVSHTGTMVWTYNEYKWVLEHIVCTNFLSRYIKICLFIIIFDFVDI